VVVVGNRFQEVPLEGGAGVPGGHALPPARGVVGERCDSSWVGLPVVMGSMGRRWLLWASPISDCYTGLPNKFLRII
jgi:hypothetical protein